jgi:hypothetical protein
MGQSLKGRGRFIRFTGRDYGEEGDEEGKDQESDLTIWNSFLHWVKLSSISLIFQCIHQNVMYNGLRREVFFENETFLDSPQFDSLFCPASLWGLQIEGT